MIDSRTGQLKRESPESTGFPFGMCFSSNGKQVHVCHSVFSNGVDDKSSGSFVSSFGKRRLRSVHKQKLKGLLPTGPSTLCAIKNGWVATRKGMASSDGNLISTGHISARGRWNQGISWSFLDVGSSTACNARNGLVVYNNIAPINVRGFGYNHIAVRSATTGKLIYQLRGQKTKITGLALANGGRQVVSGDDKGTIRVWDLPPVPLKRQSSAGPQPPR
jgi:WD40 repeat protein